MKITVKCVTVKNIKNCFENQNVIAFDTAKAIPYFTPMANVYKKQAPAHMLWGVINGEVSRFAIANNHFLLNVVDVYKVVRDGIYRYYRWVPKANDTIELYTTLAEALQVSRDIFSRENDEYTAAKKQNEEKTMPARDDKGRFIKKDKCNNENSHQNVSYSINVLVNGEKYNIELTNGFCCRPCNVKYYYKPADDKNIISDSHDVNRECYDKIFEIINGDGTISEKFNSIVDICEEYKSENLEGKTKEELIEIIKQLRR